MYGYAIISTDSAVNNIDPTAVLMPVDDKIMVVWVKDTEKKDLWGRVIKLDSSTTASTSTTTFNVLQDSFLIAEGFGFLPSNIKLLVYSDNKVLVSWNSPTQVDKPAAVHWTIVGIDGQIVIPRFQVTSDEASTAEDVVLLPLASNRIAIAWNKVTIASSTEKTSNIYLRIFEKTTTIRSP